MPLRSALADALALGDADADALGTTLTIAGDDALATGAAPGSDVALGATADASGSGPLEADGAAAPAAPAAPGRNGMIRGESCGQK